jgi:hypothetical protein
VKVRAYSALPIKEEGKLYSMIDLEDDLSPKNWFKYYVKIREEYLQKEDRSPCVLWGGTF